MNDAEIARTESAFRELNEAIATTAAKFEADETGADLRVRGSRRAQTA